jgi:hypothetical protein
LNSQNGHNIEHLATTRARKAQTASRGMMARAPPPMGYGLVGIIDGSASSREGGGRVGAGCGTGAEAGCGTGASRGKSTNRGGGGCGTSACCHRDAERDGNAARGGMYLAVATWGWEETTTAVERAGEGSPGRRAASPDPATHRASATRVEQKTRRRRARQVEGRRG